MRLIKAYSHDELQAAHTTATEGALVSRFGGKAIGLARMLNQCMSTPPFWALECKNTVDRGLVNTSQLPKTLRYAVRSGAAVSMPGAMHTQLNVPHKDLQAAVEAVWDSWFSEPAKAYREAKGINHQLGTGVVIMPMLEAKISGVCFTSDVNNPALKKVYNPLIQYVPGYGDALVGGTKTPTTLTESNDPLGIYDTLSKFFRGAHNTFGASDLEWVVDTLNQFYYVQYRPLKFAVESMPPAEGCGEVIAFGSSVGSKCKVVGKLVMADSLSSPTDEFLADKVLYVLNFTPEVYPMMLKAKAILASVGGEACHAAIVAKDVGKPAITNVDYHEICPRLHESVYVNGENGGLYTVQDVSKVITISTVSNIKDDTGITPVDKRRAYPLMAETLTELGVSLYADTLLTRFYLTLDAYQKGLISRGAKNDIVNELADVILTYLLTACVGELRHSWYNVGPLAKQPQPDDGVRYITHLKLRDLEKYGICKPDSELSPSRDKFIGRVVDNLSHDDTVEIFATAKEVFQLSGWGKSFGGLRWAGIATTALNYVLGHTSPTIFLDSVFNLQHNCGSVFGKYSWMSYTTNITDLLDAKKESITLLRTTAAGLPKPCGEQTMHLDAVKYTIKPLDTSKELLPSALWNIFKGETSSNDTTQVHKESTTLNDQEKKQKAKGTAKETAKAA